MKIDNNHKIIKLRERGQITIPEKTRNLLPWLYPQALLRVETKQQKIIISPFLSQIKKEKKKKLTASEWKEIYTIFKKIRKSGKQINGLKIIIEDRKKH